MPAARPPARDALPGLPPGATVTAWDAGITGLLTKVTPRQAMVLLLHVSWLRWHEYSALLKKQVDEREGTSRGLIGHRTAASTVMGGLYPVSEEIRALVKLEGEERDRCARLARDCHDMGIMGDDGGW